MSDMLDAALSQVVAELAAAYPDRISCLTSGRSERSNAMPRLAQMASNLLENGLTHGSTSTPVRFQHRTWTVFSNSMSPIRAMPFALNVLDAERLTRGPLFLKLKKVLAGTTEPRVHGRRLEKPLTYEDVTAVQAMSGPNIMPATNSDVDRGRDRLPIREDSSQLIGAVPRVRDLVGPTADVDVEIVKRRMNIPLMSWPQLTRRAIVPSTCCGAAI